MRFSDLPHNPNFPIQDIQKDWVLQATVAFGDNFIRLSDTNRDLNYVPSDRVGIVVEGSVDMVKHAFSVLSEEGNVDMPLEGTFFSPAYGSFTISRGLCGIWQQWQKKKI